MNIIFFGSSSFAIASFKALIKSRHKIACVVTQPDRKSGRDMDFSFTPIKEEALKQGLKIFQPEKINTADSIDFLKVFVPDLFVVISYGQILSREILNIPKILPLNIHGSLLPKYRGAAPVNRALIDGEKITGVSIIKMIDALDAGPIIFQKSLAVSEEDNAATLLNKLAALGAESLLEALEKIENNKYDLTAQRTDSVSFAPKLKKEDGLIDWEMGASSIHNLIRGCFGWPGAFTYYEGKILKIHSSAVSPSYEKKITPRPGEIQAVGRQGIVVACGKCNLLIKELQIEGKKKMSAEDFLSGKKIVAGKRLGNRKPINH